MNEKAFNHLLRVATVLVCAAVFFGCETDSARQKVTVTPSAVAINKGESVTLTAAGGYAYTWELKYESWGFLTTKEGPVTIYTSRVNANEVSVAAEENQSGPVAKQVVTAISMIPGDPDIYDDYDHSDHTPATSDQNYGNYPNTGGGGGEEGADEVQPYQVRGVAYISHL